MRLRETRDLLKKYSHLIQYSATKLNNGDYDVKGLQKAINAIDSLTPLGFLDPDIERLKKFDVVYRSKSNDDRMRLSSDTQLTINRIITTAREKVEGYQKLITNSIPEHEENVVSVKLPQYRDLEDLSKFFKTLDTAMQSGLKNDQIKGEYHLQNFDTGTLWIDIAVGSIATVNFFGRLISTAMNVKEKSYHVQIAQKELEAAEIQVETLDIAKSALEKKLDAIVDHEISALNGEVDINHEVLGEMKLSVKLLSKLINEGTEFHRPLNAPEEVNTFPEPPTTEALNRPKDLLEQVTQFLEENNNENQE